MAEKKERTIISADSGAAKKETAAKPAAAKKEAKTTTETGKTVKQAKESSGSATGNRVGAVILWLLAIACEVFGILMLFGKVNITFVSTLVAIIGVLVIDLIFVIIGSLLWKKSNLIDPASEKNKLKFFLWNNMGVIVCIVAFFPYLILLLSNKNLDKKTKTIASVVAVIAILIGSLFSFDWNPVSAEQKAAAESVITDDVYWTMFGKCYHTNEDCGSLNNSDTLYKGTVTKAIEENRTRLCSFCARNDAKLAELATDAD
ncbi:MAG: hypothetical protein MJ131_05190 [Lachnospiraceae bacterium]|nr:hypothetical protein [Lachnospiraceae bacterium]